MTLQVGTKAGKPPAIIQAHVGLQAKLKEKMGEEAHKKAIDLIKKQLHQDHGKHARVQADINKIAANANKNKPQNA